jgi:hypothetical protein
MFFSSGLAQNRRHSGIHMQKVVPSQNRKILERLCKEEKHDYGEKTTWEDKPAGYAGAGVHFPADSHNSGLGGGAHRFGAIEMLVNTEIIPHHSIEVTFSRRASYENR